MLGLYCSRAVDCSGDFHVVKFSELIVLKLGIFGLRFLTFFEVTLQKT